MARCDIDAVSDAIYANLRVVALERVAVPDFRARVSSIHASADASADAWWREASVGSAMIGE